MGDRVDNALSAIRKAGKRLQPEQGERARRNAREAMLTALRQARAALDAEFPLLSSERKTRRSSSPLAKQRRKADFERKHRQVDSAQAATLQARGVPTVRRLDHNKVPRFWVPLWVRTMMDAKEPMTTIVDCVRDWRKRKRVLALIQLGHARTTKRSA